jgi:DNA-binding MarR family transcriptional regulator
MAELVQYLEEHGYVRRVPNPQDGRAKLGLPTARGREVVAIAQSLAPELEKRLIKALGRTRWQELRDDLGTIQDLFDPSHST